MEERNNRESWLVAGMQALAGEGPQGLKIMPIAEKLGVTKGSFYWHFRDLQDFRAAVLADWERCHTELAIMCVEGDGGDSLSRLQKWIHGAVHADFRLENAIRAWGLHDETAREVLDRVDQRRIGYLVKLLQEMGWPTAKARTLGEWTYCAWVGYATMSDRTFGDKQLATVLAILTQPATERSQDRN